MREQLSDNDLSHLDVIYILLLLQGAMGLLSGTAMFLFMAGNPSSWPLALGVPLLLFVVAVGVTRGNRWARRAAITAQAIVMLGFGASFLLGLLPQVDMSFNLMTLLTNVVMPVTLIVLLRRPIATAASLNEPALMAAAVVGDARTTGRS